MLTEQKLSLPTSYSRSPNPLKEPVSVSPPPPQLQPESQKNVTTVVNSTESISLPPANQTDSQDTFLPSCSSKWLILVQNEGEESLIVLPVNSLPELTQILAKKPTQRYRKRTM
ncbi:Uncharacterized protein Rs2_06868 [Raphanus sativus]|nr:Uncharacterized protein Rs2_06868 [Raphanus sativus]